MGRIKKGFIKGVVGDAIFRELHGQQIVASRPKRIKQAGATKLHQLAFGKVSMLARNFRTEIEYLNNDFEDATMANRLTQAFFQSIKSSLNMTTGKYIFEADSFDNLSNFSFNPSSAVIMSMAIKPSATFEGGKLKINIPEFDVPSKIAFPKRADFCEIAMSLSVYNLHDGKMVDKLMGKKFRIDKDQGIFEGLAFEFEAPEGCLYILTLFNYFYYHYMGNTDLLNSKTFHPCGIYKALYNSGQFQNNGTYQWTEIGNRDVSFK